MTDDIQSFLASSPVFHDVPPEQLAEIAPLFRAASFPVGTVILRQGGYSAAVYFLRSGRLAVRIQRGELRETVAYLQPPAVFGELSFVTGKACVADVEVVVDADVVFLPKENVPSLPRQRDALLRGLLRAIAERLQETVIRGVKAPDWPVVLLANHPAWEAPRSFAAELAASLARQTGRETLLVNLEPSGDGQIRVLAAGASVCNLPASAADHTLRATVAERLTEWKSRFEAVILNPLGAEAAAVGVAIEEFANFCGELLGPGKSPPPVTAPARFVVQSAVRPTLSLLSANQQLAFEAAESESAHLAGRAATPRFRRTVDSIARCIGGLQVGLALGGGAAWGWAHIGVLEVLEQAGLPVDVIAGCSMGSVIGAFRSAGTTIAELKEIAEYWRTRTRRFLEWRLWRMSLISEKKVRSTFRRYLGDRLVNQTEIPFWANAVDVRTGAEAAIQDGSLVDCVRASIALPGLLPPAARDSRLLVDAGVMDPVPAGVARRMGAHYVIAINAMAALENQKMGARYPFNAFEIMTRCMFIMGHEIGQARAEQLADVIFTPALGEITMLQFNRSPEIIECGRRAAMERLPAILAGYERLKTRTPGPQPAQQQPMQGE